MDKVLDFGNAEFYTYEMISKKDTDKYLKNFDESANRINKDGGVMHSASYFGRDFTSVVHEWDLNEGIDSCWSRIDEFDQFRYFDNIKSRSVLSKPYVKEFRLFLIEIPYLPYNFVIIKAILNAKKEQEVIDSNEQLNILMAINDYMDRFPEIVKKIHYGGKHRPCYLKFSIDVEDSFIEEIMKEMKILSQNKELKDTEQIKKYHDSSKRLRLTHFDPKSLDYKMISGAIKGKSYSVLGRLEGFLNEIEYNNYEITFNPKNKNLNWAMHTGFNNNLDYDFSCHLHFVSVSIFLTHTLRKLDDYEVNITKLISEYQRVNEKNINEKKSLYHKLNILEESLFFVKSEFDMLDFFVKNPLNQTMIQIHTCNLMSSKQHEAERYFSEGMLKMIFEGNKNGIKQIQNKLSNIQKQSQDLKNKFEKDIIFDNTLSMSKYSKRTFLLSISMLTVSVIIAGQIIYNIFYP